MKKKIENKLIKCAYTKLVPLEDIHLDPNNSNTHPEEQIDELVEQFKFQGIRHPIIISLMNGFVAAGEGRYLAAKKMGLKEYPCDFQNFDSEEQQFAFGVADNAIQSWSKLDLTKIHHILPDMDAFNIDRLAIKDFKFEPDEPKCDEDEIPEIPKVSKVRLGDLWELGQHRILCGDSTKKEDVDRLMGGEKADIFLTDPPYGVSYTEKNIYLNSIGTGHRLTNAIENDSLSIEEMGKIWLSAYQNAIANSSDRASFYIFSPQGGDLMMMMMIEKAGWTLKHMLVWVKNNHVLGRCDYHYKHEPIFYGWNKVHDFYGGSSCFSVLEFDKPLKNDLHPTMKPIELLEKLIINSSKKEGSILDLFLGSGSTLIACEKTKRRCFGMEIDPHYCDVILNRWAKYTGKDPVREDGKKWSEVKE